jgi:hypothetical protein
VQPAAPLLRKALPSSRITCNPLVLNSAANLFPGVGRMWRMGCPGAGMWEAWVDWYM